MSKMFLSPLRSAWSRHWADNEIAFVVLSIIHEIEFKRGIL